MKVHLELEIEPEELRRLVGLPDMQPIWDSVQKPPFYSFHSSFPGCPRFHPGRSWQ